MAKFTDREGHEWTVVITHGHVGPLKKEAGVDLADALKEEGNSLAEAIGDPLRFPALLWVLCRREAKAAGVDQEEFGYRIDSEVAEAATAAIFEAVLEYFPQFRKAAKRLGTAFRKVMNETRDETDRRAEQALDQTQRELISNLSAGNSAASAG